MEAARDSATTGGGLVERVARWPGVRTLRSARFRLVIGVALWVVGLIVLGALMARQMSQPTGGFGIDFADYRAASLRLLDGRSPYAPEMLEGPVAAQGTDRYRYPPVFAQLITPLAVLPERAGAILWAALQGVLIFAATWLASSVAGARSSVPRFVWTGVAVTYFLPVFATVWTGNVDGVLAASVGALLAVPALGPRGAAVAGLLTGAAAIFKLTPFAFLPAVLRRGGPVAVGASAGLVGLVVASVALSPSAWADYARVLPNLVAGSADYSNNLSPAIVVDRYGAPNAVVGLVRLGALIGAVVMIVASVRAAGSPSDWPAAVALGAAASLLVPPALWYHYLAILLPLAAVAWSRGGTSIRVSLVLTAALVVAGIALTPLATLGAAAMTATVLAGLTPLAGRPLPAPVAAKA